MEINKIMTIVVMRFIYLRFLLAFTDYRIVIVVPGEATFCCQLMHLSYTLKKMGLEDKNNTRIIHTEGKLRKNFFIASTVFFALKVIQQPRSLMYRNMIRQCSK